MKLSKLIFLLIIILLPSASFAMDDIDHFSPAIKNEPLNMDDIVSLMGLNIYKYQLMIPPKHKIKITLKNYEKNRVIFQHYPEITDDYKYTLKVSFTAEEDIPWNPFNEKNEWANYSINWNYRQVFSGTIQNFLKDYKNTYSEIFSSDFGKTITGKTSLIKFYTSDDDKLIAELYLEVNL